MKCFGVLGLDKIRLYQAQSIRRYPCFEESYRTTFVNLYVLLMEEELFLESYVCLNMCDRREKCIAVISSHPFKQMLLFTIILHLFVVHSTVRSFLS